MPSASAAGVKLHCPLLPATTLPKTVLPLYRVTRSPAPAWPLRIGVLSVVLSLLASSTSVLPLSSVTISRLLVAGTPASMLTVNTGDAGLTLPAASVTVVVRLCCPLVSASGVKLQLPLLPAVTLPSSVVPS